eukprot:1140784-Pelagomonas_calceolata.AAC.2
MSLLRSVKKRYQNGVSNGMALLHLTRSQKEKKNEGLQRQSRPTSIEEKDKCDSGVPPDHAKCAQKSLTGSRDRHGKTWNDLGNFNARERQRDH